MTQRNSLIRWLGLAILTISGCGQESRMTPVPLVSGELEKLAGVESLRPHIRKLIAESEAGRLLGEQSDKYQAELDLADSVESDSKVTTYCFYAIPEMGENEGNGILEIDVQNKFGHIVRCSVVILVQ